MPVRRFRIFTVALAAMGVVGCGGGDSGSSGGPVNQPPTITGTAATAVVVGTNYSFIPSASDPEGQSLSYSINAKPDWAVFDSTSGALTGSPAAIDLGTYPDIRISVTAGADTSNLPLFKIDVVQVGAGSLSLSWTAPTENADGSPLSDLAAYRIRWGNQSGNYPNLIDIDSPGVTRYVLDNLVQAEYYLVISAVDDSDNKSEFSGEAFGIVD